LAEVLRSWNFFEKSSEKTEKAEKAEVTFRTNR